MGLIVVGYVGHILGVIFTAGIVVVIYIECVKPCVRKWRDQK